MKRIFFILFTLWVTLLPVMGENVRFTQVTDVHTNSKNMEYVKDLTKQINNLENIDFVIFTGDNIDSPNIKDLDAFLDAIFL